MIGRLAAEAAENAPNVIGLLLQWGVPGLVVALMLLGWLVPKPSHEQMRTDRDAWKDAYERERDAHQATRDAFVDASRSAGAAVETARTATGLLDRLGHPSNPGAMT
ncbi:hypothetical protein [Polymorphospora lycopeni]|uniref:Uncharacterized protein n=1 Tax=Polymorphospora lycopeni TaxID=3140240 RepID=A0ABV5CKW6_9ACTN